MALEAVVFSEGYYFGCGGGGAMAAEAAAGGAWSWSHGYGGGVDQGKGVSHGYGGGVDQGKGVMELVVDDGVVNAFWDGGGGGASSSPVMAAVPGFIEEPDGGNSSVADAAPPPPEHGGAAVVGRDGAAAAPAAAAGRRKRRRARTVKNREEVESQRMTHIAVERNRRKQMNEYLAVLRSLMPASYVQRGDQASIIGGAINYVKEMEQLLQSLEAQRHARRARTDDVAAAALPFEGFFTFPQYSMSATPTTTATAAASATENGNAVAGAGADDEADASGSKPSSVADIEVTMVESHANLKVLSRLRPRQLLRMVAGLQHHRLAVLHLNVASAGHMALYSLSLKVEDDCQLTSVDDIAAAVHGIVETIEQEQQQQQQKQSCS
uniref:BHLH domain-containing protein n=1 Tax=Oryza meridionalis TaxID=40149 RepID=A0A0E0EMF4_9ORYZ